MIRADSDPCLKRHRRTLPRHSRSYSLLELLNIGGTEKVGVAVFLIPDLHNLQESFPFRKIHDDLVEFGIVNGLPVFDLYPVFQNYSPEEELWITPQDPHPNGEGQLLIAEGIYDALENHYEKIEQTANLAERAK